VTRELPRAAWRKIVSENPLMLACGHEAHLMFRGLRTVGHEVVCVACSPKVGAEIMQDAEQQTHPVLFDVAVTYDKAGNPREGAPVPGRALKCSQCGGFPENGEAIAGKEHYFFCSRACFEGYQLPEEAPVSQALVPHVDLNIIRSAVEAKRPELTQATQESSYALQEVRKTQITCPEVLDWASGTTKFAKDWIDYLDGEREKLTKPLNEEKRAVDDAFMPAIKNWRAVEADLKSKMGAYYLAQRQAQEQAMRQSAQVYQQGGIPVEPIPVVVQAEGVGVRELWDFEITNPVLVPRELCSPDPEKIELRRQVTMADSNEPPNIPGVRFFKTAQVAVRRK